ncbi:hypothetical protein [Novosphingobium sp.]|uniref:hypothetical protein n=1 Tax=Novosphingobium sp. TaxID=1874826 RepID=UPI00286D47CB|nr:hypothetical protein [Novosphingobium sp.]
MQIARRMIPLALAYFAGVFALAFCVGVGRTLWLAPRVGAFAAVMAELPVILAASWWWSRRLLSRHPLAARTDALVMGAAAFALLMAAEAALAVLLGGSVTGWLSGLATPAGMLGLAGQLGFAVMPWAVWRGAVRSR